MTPEELVFDWTLRRLSYQEQMGRDYGDLDKNKMVMIMDWQLAQCIEELESVIKGKGHKTFLERLLKSGEAK